MRLKKQKVVQIHRKRVPLVQRAKLRFIGCAKALKNGHRVRNRIHPRERIRLFKGSFPAFHGVNQVFSDEVHIRIGKVSLHDVKDGGGHAGAVSPGAQLDALLAGIGALVELARQGLHGKNPASVGQLRQGFLVYKVALRLRKYGDQGVFIRRFRDSLRIVTVQNAQSGKAFNAKAVMQLAIKSLGRNVKAGAFFGIAAADNRHRNLHLFLAGIAHSLPRPSLVQTARRKSFRFVGRVPVSLKSVQRPVLQVVKGVLTGRDDAGYEIALGQNGFIFKQDGKEGRLLGKPCVKHVVGPFPRFLPGLAVQGFQLRVGKFAVVERSAGKQQRTKVKVRGESHFGKVKVKFACFQSLRISVQKQASMVTSTPA